MQMQCNVIKNFYNHWVHKTNLIKISHQTFFEIVKRLYGHPCLVEKADCEHNHPIKYLDIYPISGEGNSIFCGSNIKQAMFQYVAYTWPQTWMTPCASFPKSQGATKAPNIWPSLKLWMCGRVGLPECLEQTKNTDVSFFFRDRF